MGQKNKYRNIPVLPKTFDRLKELGNKGDTWDDVINKLLDEYKGGEA